MAYHYINVIDDYRDITTTLKERFNILPKMENYIGYQYNNIAMVSRVNNGKSALLVRSTAQFMKILAILAMYILRTLLLD